MLESAEQRSFVTAGNGFSRHNYLDLQQLACSCRACLAVCGCSWGSLCLGRLDSKWCESDLVHLLHSCCRGRCVMQADTQMSITAYRPLQYEAGPGFPLGPWGRTNLAGVSVNSCDKLLEGLHASVLPPNRRFLCVAKPTALTIQEVRSNEQLLS